MKELMELSLLDEVNLVQNPDDEVVKKHLLAYLRKSNDLLFSTPQEIKRAQRILGKTAIRWAINHSPIYSKYLRQELCSKPDCLDRMAGKFFVEKGDLSNKEQWYVSGLNSTATQTSGSTGSPFKYRIWDDAFLPIERDHHYLMVLKEFGLEESPRVLHMVSGITPAEVSEEKRGECVLKVSRNNQIRSFIQRLHCGHGSPTAVANHIEFNEQAFIHIKDYCSYIMEFILTNKINVLLASGVVFELLTTHLITDENHAFPLLVDLMSNTGDRVNPDTLDFLRETGVTKHTCDHMRCWDGGVGFFTCKHGTYHLNEELAYVFTDSEKRLASIDFFALASPFINYLNGDMAEISTEWSHCKCGRWYRPFKFLSRRANLQKSGSGFYDSAKVERFLKEQYKVEFIGFQDSMVSIEDSKLTPEQKKEIVMALAKEQVAVNFFTRANLQGISMLKQVTD